MLITGIYVLNIILSYFYIDSPLLSFLGGTSLCMILFMYLTSVVFRFCVYHRMFIHYILLNWILNIIDYYIGIPLTNRGIFLLCMTILGLFLFFVLYLKFNKREPKSM